MPGRRTHRHTPHAAAPGAALAVIAVLAHACREPPPPPLPDHPPTAEAPALHPPPLRWHRVGKVEGDALAGGKGFVGARAAAAACPQTGTCRVERWVAEDEGGELVVVITPDRVLPTTGERWRRRWSTLTGALPGCLGDPLADPPGGDPAALRSIEEVDGAKWWRLTLAGHDRCAIEGTLRLQVDADRADASALRCGGSPWHEGGSALALRHLRAWLRAEAVTAWPEASEEERRRWIERLADDPDAGPLLDELATMP